MTHQPSFAHAEFAAKKKVTRREKFLARMAEVIPWTQLLAVIEPFYPQGKRGRPPIGLERMLRVYFLQQWYALADEALDAACEASATSVASPAAASPAGAAALPDGTGSSTPARLAPRPRGRGAGMGGVVVCEGVSRGAGGGVRTEKVGVSKESRARATVFFFLHGRPRIRFPSFLAARARPSGPIGPGPRCSPSTAAAGLPAHHTPTLSPPVAPAPPPGPGGDAATTPPARRPAPPVPSSSPCGRRRPRHRPARSPPWRPGCGPRPAPA